MTVGRDELTGNGYKVYLGGDKNFLSVAINSEGCASPYAEAVELSQCEQANFII